MQTDMFKNQHFVPKFTFIIADRGLEERPVGLEARGAGTKFP
jgi:hypothetical protein